MLRKLLKYDFGAVIKLWCIGALAVLVLAMGGGFCQRILNSGRELHGIIDLTANMGMLLSALGILAFSVLTLIFLALRFYKNFFTDEGYLTFTLPVKLHKLINAKLILIFTVMFMTGLLLYLASFLGEVIGSENYFETLQYRFDNIKETVDYLQKGGYLGWAVLYIVELVGIGFFMTLFNYLFLFCCITFGSIVAKRAKVAASIGIYFGANFVFSIVVAIFMSFGISAFILWVGTAKLTETQGMQIAAAVMFGIMALMAMLCSLLYTLQYRLLDRKLNLP